MNNIFVLGDIFPSCDRKSLSYINVNSKSADADNNECVSAQPGRLGFVPGSFLHAVHAGRDASQGLHFRRNYVQIAAVSPRCV